MLRGLLAGLLSGTALSGVVLGAVSLLSDVPGSEPPEAAALDVPAGSEFNQQRDDEETTLTPLDERPAGDSVPQVVPPEPDDLASLEAADTDPAAAPATGRAEGDLGTPDAAPEDADVAVQGEDPVLPNPQAMPPQPPESEQDLSISTVPAQPVLPEAEDSAFPAPAAQPDAPDAPGEDTTSDETPDAAGTDADSQAAAEVDAPSQATQEADAQAPAELPAEAPTQAAPAPEPEETPSSTIGDLAPDVTTQRLPSIGDPETPQAALEGDAPQDDAEAATQGADDATAAESAAAELPPITRFAAPFENPENKPLMSIILIDNGTSPIGPAALADFPYPVSFAIDVTRPDAAEIAEGYRAAGLEVLAMADLPETASPQDAEVAMAAALRAVPEAVAVMEGIDTGLQGSRDAAEQLAPILLDSGHGLVMFSNGLDTIQKLIAREGVPAATVFRDFDSEDQSATVIRRFLDQAAFRAGQEEGGVIMVGRLRPDTISALLLWGLQDRAASVALAPVSAVLTAAE